MNYSFHPEAETEFLQAIEYYEECEENLGYDFAVKVYSAIRRILIFPQAWPILHDDIRRALIQRFPYGILYAEGKEEIFILALMNLHREPGYWKHRL